MAIFDEKVVKIKFAIKGYSISTSQIRLFFVLERDAPIEVVSSSGRCIPTDLLLVADGAHSQIKAMLLDDLNQSEENPLHHRGYRVFRGHSSTRRSDQGFQTWGPGARFACVPTCQGNAWFAAVTSDAAPVASYDSMLPLVNGSQATTSKDWSFLTNKFSSWHEPIGQLLRNSNFSEITVCEAFAHRKPAAHRLVPDSLGRIKPVVFMGDAAFTLDPILAQGAGLGIEDGALLHAALSRFSDLRSEPDNLSDCLDNFESMRKERILRLFHLSNLSQSLGHMESRAACTLRNFFLRGVVPSVYKTLFFNNLIAWSATSNAPSGHIDN